jgi:hypothetical protein
MKKLIVFATMVILFCFCGKSKQQFLSQEQIDWLQNEAKSQLTGCQITAHDGTILYTPDGEGNYAALWTRDFGYMVENAIDLLPVKNVKAAIEYLLNGQREDGCIPDRVQADGLAVYSAGPVGNPLGDPPADNTQFMVKLVADYVEHTKDYEFFAQHSKKLIAAMDYTTRSKNGLVYIDPANPHSPYGFTDTIQKTGELLFTSLLYWEACQRLYSLFNKIHDDNTAKFFRNRGIQIEKSINILWDENASMFNAATIDCKQIDIWGNAYAIYIDFPLGDKKENIIDYLAAHFDEFVYKGQIRHIIEPDFWGKTLIPIKPGRYQNGAYWGTASGWIANALVKTHPFFTEKILTDLVTDYQERGPHECINSDYQQLNNYVASVVNPWGAIKRLEK